ncbi:arginine/serine-rich protein 1-like [Gopherus evgoodei]|uniref:arginine/serine-rich protein 1-like n=1 Tax=Gopherus evgoodei TaxID=1825980 RepID=UPI0011CF7764|nr:arginine/serine-rich protein 1-like [Gopherus evgoodei]
MEPELPQPPAPPVRVVQSLGKPAMMRPSSPDTVQRRRSRSRSRWRLRSRHRSRSRRGSQSWYRSPSQYRSYSRHRLRSRSPSRYSRYRSRSRHRRTSCSRSWQGDAKHRSTSRHCAGRRSRSRSCSRHCYDSRYHSPVPRRQESNGRRDLVQGSLAPSWPSHHPSVSSHADSASDAHTHGQNHGPHPWSFWTPWAYHEAQGEPTGPSRSGHSEHHVPKATVSLPLPADTEETSAHAPELHDLPETEVPPLTRPQCRTHSSRGCHPPLPQMRQ